MTHSGFCPQIDERSTENGPRAVLGSQQPRTRENAPRYFRPPLYSGALRAEDGSRSGDGFSLLTAAHSHFAGVVTQARWFVIPGWIPGTTYTVQIRAVGGTTGHSDWSDPISHMAT